MIKDGMKSLKFYPLYVGLIKHPYKIKFKEYRNPKWKYRIKLTKTIVEETRIRWEVQIPVAQITKKIGGMFFTFERSFNRRGIIAIKIKEFDSSSFILGDKVWIYYELKNNPLFAGKGEQK